MATSFKNIVCIGDSTTSQEWCHPNWIDWLNFVFKQGEAQTMYNVINSGVDGATIDLYLDSFDYLISVYSPEIVILSLGFNHLENIPNFIPKSHKLVKKIRDNNANVIIWSTYDTLNQKYTDDLSQIARIYEEIAKDYDCKFVNIYKEFQKYELKKIFTYTHKWQNKPWGLKPGDIDFLHCNHIGNQIIAENILKECFDLDLSIADEFAGMGTMNKVNLIDYLKNK